MKPELHPEEKAIRDIGCLGQHDSGPWVYHTKVSVSIIVETGEIVANSKAEAERLAIELAHDMVRLHGNGFDDQWDMAELTRKGEV